jgi:hypothetical protein
VVTPTNAMLDGVQRVGAEFVFEDATDEALAGDSRPDSLRTCDAVHGGGECLYAPVGANLGGRKTVKHLSNLLLGLAALCATNAAFAQTVAEAMANRALVIAEARRANAALMHHYTWNSRTEIIVQGQVKDVRIEQVQYDPYGRLQRVLLNDQAASAGPMLPTPIGLMRRAAAEQEKQDLETFMTGLKQLIELYTLPTAGKILDFMSTATVTGPDANGMLQLSGFNVVQPGDNLTIWINAWTRHTRQVKVSTTFQGQAVQLFSTFSMLAQSGLNYAEFSEVNVPGKQLTVQMHNYNFARLAY